MKKKRPAETHSLPIVLLVLVSLLMPFLYMIASKPSNSNDVEQLEEVEKEQIFDLGDYSFNAAKFYPQLSVSKYDKLKNKKYKTIFVCISIEDKAYVDSDCSYQGQYELFRLEYLKENEIVPEEYQNYEVMTQFEDEKASLYMLWNNPPVELLESNLTLRTATEYGLINTVKDSFSITTKVED